MKDGLRYHQAVILGIKSIEDVLSNVSLHTNTLSEWNNLYKMIYQ